MKHAQHSYSHIFFRIIICASFILLPKLSFAAVRISEIMYDPPGTDTNHEWIEIENDGDVSVDIAGWKLLEANSNHSLTSIAGGTTLAAHAFAVIADNASTFQNDYPSFGGMLFDSVFSLSNSGETLVIKDGTGAVIDEATYTGALGGNGDGSTLNGAGSSWTAASASPGAAKSTVQQNENSTDDSNADASSSSENNQTGESSNSNANDDTGGATGSSTDVPKKTSTDKNKPPKKIVATIALPTTTVVYDASTTIFLKVTGSDGDPANKGRVVWNFGDGESVTTYDLSSVTHIYAFPGRYVVQAWYYENYYDNVPEATNRATLAVGSSSLMFTDDGLYLSLKNKSKSEIDISDWVIVGDTNGFSLGPSYIFPKGSILLSGSTIIIPKIKYNLPQTSALYQVYFPNGNLAATTDVVDTESIQIDEVGNNRQAAQKVSAPNQDSMKTTDTVDVPVEISIPNIASVATSVPEEVIENTFKTTDASGDTAQEKSNAEKNSTAARISKRSLLLLFGLIFASVCIGIFFNRFGGDNLLPPQIKSETGDDLASDLDLLDINSLESEEQEL